MRRSIAAVLGVAWGLAGCATGSAGRQAEERVEAAPFTDFRALGRPPELLGPAALAKVERALKERGLLDEAPLPGELRISLVAFQEAEGLAPTGWLDADTARALDLDVETLLPLVAGAGAFSSAGATAGDVSGSQVGGEPGPANPVPGALELGAVEVAAPADPVFQFEEARRLRAAARQLRGRAETETGERRRFTLAQAEKAERLFGLHARQLDELGGESALAGVELVPQARPTVRIEEGGEVRAALPAAEDAVELPPEEVERMQRALWAEGFLHQAPTSLLDEATRQAIRAFQTAQGWEPTGAVDRRTLRRLVTAPTSRQPQGLEPPGSPLPGGAAPPSETGGEGSGGAESREEAPAP